MRALPGAPVPSREELVHYWTKIGPKALPYLARRPLTLVRHVAGLTFFHKGPLPPVPESVHTLRIRKREGEQGVRVWIDDVAGLLGLVEMDAVELHPWGATVDDIERPDLLVFDLDPGPGVAWEVVAETAFAVRDFLCDEGFDPWLKTSGGKGLHVMVPVDRSMDWAEVRAWAKDAATRFAQRDERYTAVSTADRAGRIFIDYLRNGRGNTAVGAYSPRVRPRFPVSCPIAWADLKRGVRSDSITMADLMKQTSPTRRAARPKHEKRCAAHFVPPQLATLVDAPPQGERYLHEIKLDGYRGQLVLDGGNAKFFTRRGLDWSDRFAPIVVECARLPACCATIDGEAVVLDERGVSDFSRLQDALARGRADDIVFFAFDLIHLDGADLAREPLLARKQALANLLRTATGLTRIRYSDHIEGRAEDMLREGCRLGVEGIVSKRIDAPYRSGRSDNWLKSKCSKRQEFVVGGWLPREQDVHDLGALLVGFYDRGKLRYAGKVGTGFDRRTRRDLLKRLAPRTTKRQPFDEVPEYQRPFAKWVDPSVVAEVEFSEFTGDGILRHPSFKGVREDKRANDVRLEVPRPMPKPGQIAALKPRWGRFRRGAGRTEGH
jgi:DNA ligase D-like protein (predicted ligase)/DNA ligase D-like protein (predicted polymerase)